MSVREALLLTFTAASKAVSRSRHTKRVLSAILSTSAASYASIYVFLASVRATWSPPTPLVNMLGVLPRLEFRAWAVSIISFAESPLIQDPESFDPPTINCRQKPGRRPVNNYFYLLETTGNVDNRTKTLTPRNIYTSHALSFKKNSDIYP